MTTKNSQNAQGYVLRAPLQVWSKAGERHGKQSLLAGEIEHAIATQPRYIIVENTPGIITTTHLQSLMSRLKGGGYSAIAIREVRKALIVGQKN